MNILKGRPLAAFALFASCFSVLALYCNDPWFFMLPILLCLGGIVVCILSNRKGKISSYRFFSSVVVLVLCLAFSLRLSCYYCFNINIARAAASCVGEVEITCVVEEKVSLKTYSSIYTVKTKTVSGHRCRVLARLYCSFETDYDIGDALTVRSGDVELTDTSEKDDIAEECFLIVNADEKEKVSCTGQSRLLGLKSFAQNVKNRLACILRLAVGGDEGDLCASMLFGTSDADASVKRDFRRSGVSHLLAISGMHMSVLVGAFDYILSKCFFGKRMRLFCLSALIFAYLTILGFPLSALRSGIMLIISFACVFFGGDSDGLSSLSLSVGTILFLSPVCVFDCGFILSVCATFGILVLSPLFSSFVRKIKRKIKRKRQILLKPTKVQQFADKTVFFLLEKVLPAFSVIISANIMTALPVAVFFGEFSLMSVPGNVFLPFVAEICLFFCIAVLCSFSGCFLHGLASFYARKLAGIMLCVTSDFSDIRGVCVSLGYDFVKIVLTVALCVTLVLFVIKLRHKWLSLMPFFTALTVLAVFYCFFLPGWTEVYVNDNKSSENIVLVSKGTSVIVDVSNGNYNDIYDMTELAFDNGATEIEELVFTHYHVGHIAASQKIMGAKKVRRVYLPQPKTSDDASVFLGIIDSATDAGVDCFLYDENDVLLLFGEFEMTLSGPERIKRSTHPLTVVNIKFGDERLMYVGKSAFESEALASCIDADENTSVLISSHGPVNKQKSAINLSEAKRICCFDTGLLQYVLACGDNADYYGKVYLHEKTAYFRFGNKRSG